MAFMPAREETLLSKKDFDPPKVANKEEKQAAQQLLPSNNNNPISLSAICIGLLSLVTMLVVRLRRGLQPAAILASSSGLGPDMPMNTKSALGDNVMEMKSQDSHVKVNSGRIGWAPVRRPQTCLQSSSSATDRFSSLPKQQQYEALLLAALSGEQKDIDLALQLIEEMATTKVGNVP